MTVDYKEKRREGGRLHNVHTIPSKLEDLTRKTFLNLFRLIPINFSKGTKGRGEDIGGITNASDLGQDCKQTIEDPFQHPLLPAGLNISASHQESSKKWEALNLLLLVLQQCQAATASTQSNRLVII